MLPVGSNYSSSGCSEISSNCVIWQGPNIPCLSLCKGDTVSEVVAKLGEQLCDVLTDCCIDIATLNLACLSLGSTPTSSTALIQALVTKICSLQSQISAISVPAAANLTCSVAACLQAAAGGATLGVVSYAQLLGTRLCTLESTVTTLQGSVVSNGNSITSINNTLGTLAATYAPKNSTYVCLGSGSASLTSIVSTIEQKLCDLQTVTGSTTLLSNSIVPYCNLSNEPALSTTGTMASAYADRWKTTVSTVADSINNLWITVCDLRNEIESLKACCTKTCADIDLGFLLDMTSSTNLRIRLTGTSVIPAGFVQCPTPGSTITLSVASPVSNIPFTEVYNFPNISNLLGGSNYYDLNLANTQLDLSDSYQVGIAYCFTDNEGLVCQNTLTYIVNSNISCPTLSLSSTLSGTTYTLSYSFNNVYSSSSTKKYRIKLYTNADALLSETTTNIANTYGGTISGTLQGLTVGTYKVEISIIDVASGVDVVSKVCPKQTTIVGSGSCPPVTNLDSFIIN